MMINPDIDIIGLAATIVLAFGFVPYAFRLARIPLEDIVPVISSWDNTESKESI